MVSTIETMGKVISKFVNVVLFFIKGLQGDENTFTEDFVLWWSYARFPLMGFVFGSTILTWVFIYINRDRFEVYIYINTSMFCY